MGGYGKTLPVTGAGVLAIGGGVTAMHLTIPVIAGIGTVLILGGLLTMRLLRPAKSPSE